MKRLADADRVCLAVVLLGVLMPAVGAAAPLLVSSPWALDRLAPWLAIAWTWHGFAMLCIGNTAGIAGVLLFMVGMAQRMDA